MEFKSIRTHESAEQDRAEKHEFDWFITFNITDGI